MSISTKCVTCKTFLTKDKYTLRSANPHPNSSNVTSGWYRADRSDNLLSHTCLDALLNRGATRGSQSVCSAIGDDWWYLKNMGYIVKEGVYVESQDSKKWKEEAVDEQLIGEIYEIIWRRALRREDGQWVPETERIVVSTGDGAPGFFDPDGFYGAIIGALEGGIEVELWAWRDSISSRYTDLLRSGRWGNRFKIRYFDSHMHVLGACVYLV